MSKRICPQCGSRKVAHSHVRWYEYLIRFFYKPYRCLACKDRFWKFTLFDLHDINNRMAYPLSVFLVFLVPAVLVLAWLYVMFLILSS